MVWSVVLFLIGAVFGLMALLAILKNQPTPKMSVYLHGIFQVIAFIILLVAAARATRPPTAAIVLLALAALGGIVLFALDMQGKKIPRALAIAHPIIAVVGLLALIIFLAGGGDVARAAAEGDGVDTTMAAPGNTGAGGMGGTTATGTMGGAGTGTGVLGGIGDTARVHPDSGRLDDDRNRPGTQSQSGIGRQGVDTTRRPR